MKFVFFKDQSIVNIGKKEKKHRKAIIVPRGMERKKHIRKSREDGQKNLVDHWQWRVKICPVSVLWLSTRIELTTQDGTGKRLG